MKYKELKEKQIRGICFVLVLLTIALCAMGCTKREVSIDSSSTTPVFSKAGNTSEKNPSPSMEYSASSTDSFKSSVPYFSSPIFESSPENNSSRKPPEPEDEDLVLVTDFIPSIFIDLKYATTDNFTGKIIYDFTDAYLRYGTVKKLAEVQKELLKQGFSLKIWDAYRPVESQFVLWEVCPDSKYVANPNVGYSNHSRGNCVDVTIVASDGKDIPVPTGFDDFTPLADRDYRDVPEEALKNVTLLENTMSEKGFRLYPSEWWHFADSTEYLVIKE